MKKINIMTVVLMAYLLIMSYIGWPGRNKNLNYTEYFIIIGVTIVIILLLRFLRIKMLRMREKREKDINRE